MAGYQEPKAPANAYYSMVEILGEDWFIKPAPMQGKVLTVMGQDRIPTEWFLSDGDAARALQRVRNNRYIACTDVRPFRSSGAAA